MSDKEEVISHSEEEEESVEDIDIEDEIIEHSDTEIMGDEKKDVEEVPMTETPPLDDRKNAESPVGNPEDKLLDDKKEKEKRGLSLERVKGFFHLNPKDKAVKVEVTEEVVNEAEPVEVIKAPPRRWFKCKKAEGNGECGQSNMTIGLNMIDRDEHNVNETVKLGFENIFAEPEGWHSNDCAWRVVFRVFKCVSLFVYRVLALLVFLPLALIWAVVFAFLAASHVWLCTPFARAIAIPATWLAKVWNFLIRSLFDPCFRSCGLCLGQISVRRYGFSHETTQDVAMIA